jgi:hypothetical protein
VHQSHLAQAPRQEKQREKLTYAQPIVQKVDMSKPKVQKQTLLAQAIVQPVSDDAASHSRSAPSSHSIMSLALSFVPTDTPLLADRPSKLPLSCVLKKSRPLHQRFRRASVPHSVSARGSSHIRRNFSRADSTIVGQLTQSQRAELS